MSKFIRSQVFKSLLTITNLVQLGQILTKMVIKILTLPVYSIFINYHFSAIGMNFRQNDDQNTYVAGL
ncbi:hypothetical protein ESZ48_07130 [Gelidibacter gilvus]|uniref:Uncharacterized protein n=1 Tax=Gelidibacter gilvus TaxID=59602 RepID=A0A4Q0XJQ4_9FLAO|nr:hypothetical protein ESZ48_07130 [Gelidibacter gilvus]